MEKIQINAARALFIEVQGKIVSAAQESAQVEGLSFQKYQKQGSSFLAFLWQFLLLSAAGFFRYRHAELVSASTCRCL